MSTQLAYSVSEAADAARTCRTGLYAAIKSGALRAVKRGRRTLILAKDLQSWLNSLPPVHRSKSEVSR
jgi:excisionase family DNA binding protein